MAADSFLKACLILLIVSSHNVRAYVEMSWNTSYYFGADGPWQAVTVGVQNNRTSRLHTVNLLPCEKSLGYTYIPTPDVCALPNASAYCGFGGMMDFPSTFTNASTWNDRDEFYISGIATSVMLNSDTSRANDVVVVPVTNRSNSHTKYRTGDVPGIEAGFFYAGPTSSGSQCSITGCSFAQTLDDYDQISSTSYGLQIGAAKLNYVGSLILGGYDQARIAGPLITAIPGSVNSYGTLDPNSFRLQDIVIGIDEGGSPFDFANKTGLLHGSDDSKAQAIPVILEPSSAYIGLPQGTVTNIADSLPVTRDDKTGYYLWNTADPAYSNIITSTAYLGFVFRTSTDDCTLDITIKVPFALLSLTLEPRASGLSTAVPYLPIVVRVRSDYEFYNFGRAFLQAAFLFEDSGDNSTLLAQAPGPGANASDIRDYDGKPTGLSSSAGDEVFASSWKGYWTPLPFHKQDIGGTSYISGGAKAGVATGAIAGLVIVLAAALWFLQRRRRSEGKPPLTFRSGKTTHRQIVTPPPPVELHGTSSRVEIDGREMYHAKVEQISPMTPASLRELPQYHAR